MNIFSLQGFVSELNWDEPIFTDTPKLSVYNYNKDVAKTFIERGLSALAGNPSIKLYCDLNRICELEDAVVEWYEEIYYQRKF